MNDKPLFALWGGEFGVELGWVAGLRYAAKSYGKVIVSSFRGREALYADFATEFIPHDFDVVSVGAHWKPKGAKPDPEALVPPGCDRFPAVETVGWGNTYEEPIGPRQTWVRYGTPDPTFKDAILFHARARGEWGGERNWSSDSWAALADALKGRRLVSVGSPTGALHVAGSEDARGVPLGRLMDMMAGCRFVMGPSSGPMHLAAHCGAAHVVWVGGDGLNDARKIAVLAERYKMAWNPHKAPLALIQSRNWQPAVAMVAEAADALERAVYRLPSERSKVPVAVRQGKMRYKRADLAKQAVESVLKHSTLPHEVLVFDNSPDEAMGEWLAANQPDVTYAHAQDNVGCDVPRNWVARYAAANEYEQFIFMDQDVEAVAPGWDEDMVNTLRSHKDAGIVAWPLSNYSIPPVHPVDATGALCEVPGLCNCHDTRAALQVPCHDGYFFFRFDSDWCFHLAQHGWKTRLVLDRSNKIAHSHVHSGINANPEAGEVRKRSERLFRRRIRSMGFACPPTL
jgi:hypothetical protein